VVADLDLEGLPREADGVGLFKYTRGILGKGGRRDAERCRKSCNSCKDPRERLAPVRRWAGGGGFAHAERGVRNIHFFVSSTGRMTRLLNRAS
jgi:hypothetical protein